MGWSAYLANEESNNWCGWFDVSGITQCASGSYLEGIINLQSEFGYLPEKIYIAVGLYQTWDGGTLVKQCPAGNGNGNIEPEEFVKYTIPRTLKPENSNFNLILKQNYPNPSKERTYISFTIPNNDKVTLKVFDFLGREVATLVDNKLTAGTYNVEFDTRNLPAGVYLYELSTIQGRQRRKMVVTK